jgi:hypothetical protein
LQQGGVCMKKFLKILVIAAIVLTVSFGGVLIQSAIYDNKIVLLQRQLDKKQIIADDLIAKSRRTDTQSVTDKKIISGIFERIFTFYDLEGFEKARSIAIDYNLPTSFVNSFYDTSELSGIYAESMLDIVCKYNSAEIYFLDREEDVVYYYATVKLDTVKYVNSQIEFGFFIAIQDHGDEFERIKSLIYYNID